MPETKPSKGLLRICRDITDVVQLARVRVASFALLRWNTERFLPEAYDPKVTQRLGQASLRTRQCSLKKETRIVGLC